jgi:murein DD-endopeptidase MepM/ murein hydrolase activator NlpD
LDESTSGGYPYIRITSPHSQEPIASVGKLQPMALIEISAEVYRAQEPVEEYLKSYIPIDASRGDPLSSIAVETRISYTWVKDGLSLIFDEQDLFFYSHAALVDYPENKLLLQIRLTIGHGTIEQKQTYLETFNQVLASIIFSPPPDIPRQDSSDTGAMTDLDPSGFFVTSGNQFLTLPFDYHPDIKVVQGWIYNWGYRHNGVDFIKGIPSIPSSWTTFDVLAAADGVACVNCVYGPGNKVWIKHTVGNTVFYTYYGHLSTIDPSILTNPAVVSRGQKIGTAGNICKG